MQRTPVIRATAIALATVVAIAAGAPRLTAHAQLAGNPASRVPATSRIDAPSVRVPALVDEYREPLTPSKDVQRPVWAEAALDASRAQLRSQAGIAGKIDPAVDLRLLSVAKDDRGHADVRFTQLHDGLELFGGQIVAHLDETGALRSVDGRLFDASSVGTDPRVDAAAAVATAESEVGVRRSRGDAPVVALVLLPDALRTGEPEATGATLVYRVTIAGARNGEPGRFECFVDAQTGDLVLWYNAYCSARATLNTAYSGTQRVRNAKVAGATPRLFALQDFARGGSVVRDANDLETDDAGFPTDGFITDSDNVWGNGTTTSRQTVAGDAYYGIQRSWDYFRLRYGRLGPDGRGSRVVAYVHYGSRFNNALGGDNFMYLGDGDGTTRRPYASLDVVAHEYTHSVTGAAAGLVGTRQPGAVGEAMSDIFGTAVEFHSGDPGADYRLGEDIVIGGDSIRNLARPDIDHASEMEDASSSCNPTENNDNCSVHDNSTVVSHAFYLLAVGGTHAQSNVTVSAIGREAAENVFYKALTRHLTPTSGFHETALATLASAEELYGKGSAVYNAVQTAWIAVGVLLPPSNPPAPPGQNDLTQWKLFEFDVNESWGRVAQIDDAHAYRVIADYPTGFGEWTHVAGGTGYLFFYNQTTRAAAVGTVERDGRFTTVQSWPAGSFGFWTHIVWHDGSLFFYDANSGNGAIGRLEGDPPQLKTYHTYYGGFVAGCSSVVSVQGWLFFYNAGNVAASVGSFDEVYTGAPGSFPQLVDITYRYVKGYLGTFPAGYTNIVDTGHGVLFYNASTGEYFTGDFDRDANFTRVVSGLTPDGAYPLWEYDTVKAGYTHVVAVDGEVLFYDKRFGDGMTGFVFSKSAADENLHQPLAIVNRYGEGSLSDPRETRWSVVVPVAIPGTVVN
jgi:Zn-dependent metalloprotease